MRGQQLQPHSCVILHTQTWSVSISTFTVHTNTANTTLAMYYLYIVISITIVPNRPLQNLFRSALLPCVHQCMHNAATMLYALSPTYLA